MQVSTGTYRCLKRSCHVLRSIAALPHIACMYDADLFCAGGEPALQLRLGEGQYVTFEGFKSSGLADALGLIEHLAQELQ